MSRFLLVILAVLFGWGGVHTITKAPTVMQEQAGLIMLGIATVLIVGALIIDSIHKRR